MTTTSSSSPSPGVLSITYRGIKVELDLWPTTTVQQVKEHVIAAVQQQAANQQTTESLPVVQPHELKLLFKGKVLQDEVSKDDHHDSSTTSLYRTLVPSSSTTPKTTTPKKVWKLLATGLSQAQVAQYNATGAQQQAKLARQVRDDLSDAGIRQHAARQRQGRHALQQAAQASHRLQTANQKTQYGFGRIEPLPHLPHQDEARRILESLANDPGILACMAKHKWQVGALAELYPEGKVGESAICVMGLNENKGQRIKLRIRTDDLQGFRKPLTIRKVLYHELAHNVHSEHNQDFFVLMRQIERDCQELDWTQGAGLTTGGVEDTAAAFEGGTYRLGGSSGSTTMEGPASSMQDRRDRALRAALQRMTAQEEQEIAQQCGCGRTDLFLPPSLKSSTTSPMRDDDENKQTPPQKDTNNKSQENTTNEDQDVEMDLT